VKAALIGLLAGSVPSEYLKTHSPVSRGLAARDLYGPEEGYKVCVRWHMCKQLNHHHAPGVLDGWRWLKQMFSALTAALLTSRS
jgi:hypothetical protein